MRRHKFGDSGGGGAPTTLATLHRLNRRVALSFSCTRPSSGVNCCDDLEISFHSFCSRGGGLPCRSRAGVSENGVSADRKTLHRLPQREDTERRSLFRSISR